jgi:hypothetical protein
MSRRGKWMQYEYICNKVHGNPRNTSSTLRDLRRKKFGGWAIDSKIEEIEGKRVLFYRITGKQTDNQTTFKRS